MKSGLLKHTMEIRDVTITKIIVIYIEYLSAKIAELEEWNIGIMLAL
ncbi:MAG: hypothetical protein GH151_13160 [Bacteroidetes bacterium]|nr:hypothetical protein [Bacteroidota bacterium]